MEISTKKKVNDCSERGINKVLWEFRSMRHKCLQTKSGQASVQSGVYAVSLDLGVVTIIIISSISHGLPENSKAIIHALLQLVNQQKKKTNRRSP